MRLLIVLCIIFSLSVHSYCQCEKDTGNCDSSTESQSSGCGTDCEPGSYAVGPSSSSTCTHCPNETVSLCRSNLQGFPGKIGPVSHSSVVFCNSDQPSEINGNQNPECQYMGFHPEGWISDEGRTNLSCKTTSISKQEAMSRIESDESKYNVVYNNCHHAAQRVTSLETTNFEAEICNDHDAMILKIEKEEGCICSEVQCLSFFLESKEIKNCHGCSEKMEKCLNEFSQKSSKLRKKLRNTYKKIAKYSKVVKKLKRLESERNSPKVQRNLKKYSKKEAEYISQKEKYFPMLIDYSNSLNKVLEKAKYYKEPHLKKKISRFKEKLSKILTKNNEVIMLGQK